MKRALLLALALATLASAGTASAKEGARAHLLAPLPVRPAAGSLLTVRWSVDVPGPHGTRAPFGAIGMFVQLIGRNGSSTRATAQAGPPYQARVRVPTGGIRAVRFGLMGTGCSPSGCKPSPIFFPLK